MTKPIVALRIQFEQGRVKVTPLAQNPKGARYPLPGVEVSCEGLSRKERQAVIEKAVGQVLPATT